MILATALLITTTIIIIIINSNNVDSLLIMSVTLLGLLYLLLFDLHIFFWGGWWGRGRMCAFLRRLGSCVLVKSLLFQPSCFSSIFITSSLSGTLLTLGTDNQGPSLVPQLGQSPIILHIIVLVKIILGEVDFHLLSSYDLRF